MKKIFLMVFCLLTASLPAGDLVTVWPEAPGQPADGGKCLRFDTGIGNGKAVMTVDGDDGLALVKTAVRNGRLEIDTRDFHATHPKKRVLLRVHGVPADALGKQQVMDCYLEAELAAEVLGKTMAFAFEGRQKGEKSHFWCKPREILLDAAPAMFREKNQIPIVVEKLHAIFHFSQPGIYRLGKVAWGINKDPAANLPAGNLIVNGDAERGLYNVVVSDIRRMGSSADGKYHDWFKKVVSRFSKVTVDDREFHSGRHSFKIESFTDSLFDRFSFSPVPVALNRPLEFSLWMKSDRKIPVELWLGIGPGTRYAKKVTVTPEWKRYSVSIPKWGEKAPGVYMSRNPGNNPVGTVIPSVLVLGEATVYVDDAVATGYPETVEKLPKPTLLLRGDIDRDSGCYPVGTPIAADLTAETADGATGDGTLAYEIRDYHGKAIFTAPTEKITFPFTRKFSITPPANARGPMNLVFTATAPDGSKHIHAHYFGVIEPNKPVHPRFGVNIEGGLKDFNAQPVIEILKDMRIGAVRLWTGFAGEADERPLDRVQIFKDSGMYVLYCINNLHSRRGGDAFFLPHDTAPVLKNLEEHITKYVKGGVDAYEIYNEPNIWSGMRKNPDPSKYRDANIANLIRVAKEIAAMLRRVDPQAKLAGPATCHTSPAWIASYLAAGGKDFLDIISEHPYRCEPELPDYGEDLRSIRNNLKTIGKDMPIFSSENGSIVPNFCANNLIDARSVLCAAKDIRMALVGFSNGMDKYFHFASAGNGFADNAYCDMMVTMARNGSGWQPGLYLYASRAAADILEDGKFVQEVKMGIAARCYVYDRGDRRIAMLWKWHGEPSTITFPQAVKYYDMMGSFANARELPFGKEPVYIESPLAADAFVAMLAAADVPIQGAPCAVAVETSGVDRFRVRITNNGKKPLPGKITLLTPEIAKGETVREFAAVPAGESQTVEFTAAKNISLERQTGKLRVEVAGKTLEQDFVLRALTVPHTAKKITVDGGLADWPENALKIRLGKDAFRAVGGASCPADAEMRLTWNEQGLHMAVIVNKAKFQPEERFGESGIWKGDALQVAFDTIRNAGEDTCGYQDDDFEYSLTRYQNKPLVIRHTASSSTYDSLAKLLGKVSEVPLAVKNVPGKTVYEICFPPISISPFALTPLSSMRFNIIVNLGDGEKRLGWLELTPGIGQTPKMPGKFMDLVLIK